MAKRIRGKGRPAAKSGKAKAGKGTGARRPARRKVPAIPPSTGCLVPGLAVRGADDAIAFYQKAFGAKLLTRMPGPGGTIMHAAIRLGDRVLFLGDEMPEMGAPSPQTLGGSPVSIMLYVKDVDGVFQRAVDAGARSLMQPADQFWGDRMGALADPFGHRWSIATHKVDLTPGQMKKAMDGWLASLGAKGA
jgi:uncharacterized glyoxalase superfamily protein PhnB